MNRLFYIEVTDTFAGEANYSWVTRHLIRANTERGAINRFARLSGLSWHCTGDMGYAKRYDSASGATCYFIEPYNGNPDDYQFSFSTDER